MKLQINITKEILKESMYCGNENAKESKQGQNCAIGKAIYNLFGENSWVMTLEILINKRPPTFSGHNLCFGWVVSSYAIELPEIATNFIKRFDMANPDTRLNMTPFSFIIDVPDEVIEMISLDEVYKILKDSTTMQLVDIDELS